jgi:hypothetical protein
MENISYVVFALKNVLIADVASSGVGVCGKYVSLANTLKNER